MRRNLFKAYDIRSKRSNFDEDTSKELCHAIAYYMIHDVKTYSIVLGRDTRLGSEELMQTAVDIFVQSGMTVYLELNPMGTCQFYYNCIQHTKSGGVMITASHNPGSYLGMKIVATEAQSVALNCGPKGGLATIQAYYEDSLLCNERSGGRVITMNSLDPYIDYSMRLAQVPSRSLKGLPVVCDFLHGSNGEAISRALNQSGVNGTFLHLIPNGNFPCGDPNPGSEASLQGTLKYLDDHQSPLCFVYDGDGDRMDLIYKGKQLSPGFVMALIADELEMLFAPYFVGNDQKFSPSFLFDIKANPLLLLNEVAHGKKIALVQNGHSYIKDTLHRKQQEHFLAAVEESAHYYLQLPQVVDDWRSPLVASENTLFYTLLVLRVFLQAPYRFDEAMAMQDSCWRAREWSIMIKDEEKRLTIQKEVEESILQMGAIKITENEHGESLGATLLRYNLPKTYDEHAELKTQWFQVFQRLSQSEETLLRWEVVASDEEIGEKVFAQLLKVQETYR